MKGNMSKTLFLLALISVTLAHIKTVQGSSWSIETREKEQLVMVHRCLNALKKRGLDVKRSYLCHALIKSFLIERLDNQGQSQEDLNSFQDSDDLKNQLAMESFELDDGIGDVNLRPHGPYFYSPSAKTWRKIKF